MSADIYIANELVASATLEQAYIILQSLETKFKIKEILTFTDKHKIYLH